MRSTLDLGAVFAGRLGGLLATIVFIPVYNALLSTADFGAVALILALQNFFLVSDFGLATVVGRETAAAHGDPKALAAARLSRRRAELLVASIVLAIAGAGLAPTLLAASSDLAEAGRVIAAAALLIGALVLLNVLQLCFNALHRYLIGNSLTIAGTLIRAAVTAAALAFVRADLTTFLAAQTAVALVHLAVARLWLDRLSAVAEEDPGSPWDRSGMRGFVRRCVPMMIFTASGAAALNFDKPIVSALISLEAAGHYFLATTYALLPISLLSGPLSQYFAPMVVQAESHGVAERTAVAGTFQLLVMIAVGIPAANLVLHRHFWLSLWLGGSDAVPVIAPLVAIVMVGAAVGATGYCASTFLIAIEDNRFLARLSAAAAAAVLAAAAFFASRHNLLWLAIAYALFHSLSCVALWWRVSRFWDGASFRIFIGRYYLLPAALILTSCAAAEFIAAFAHHPALRTGAALILSAFFAIVTGLFIYHRSKRAPFALHFPFRNA